MTFHWPLKKIRPVLISVLVLLIGLILIIFIRSRVHIANTKPPPPPESTGAELTIKRFRHTGTANGIRQWSLEARSASLYSKRNTAELVDIAATFYLKENRTVRLTADHGILNMKTNDMTITGDILTKIPGYTLGTQSLHYDHRLHIIRSDTPATITGPGVSLKADTVRYNLKTGTIKCLGHVKGKLSETAE